VFAEPAADVAVEGEGLLVEGDGVGVAVLHARGVAERLEGVGFAEPVADVAVDGEGLVVEGDGVGVAVLHGRGVAE